MAYQYVDRHAPFYVINLDLCGSVTALAEHGIIPNLEAIRTLCDVQIQRRGQPWLLFLTTRVIREKLDHQTRKRLLDCLLKNIAASTDFSTLLRGTLGFDEATVRSELQVDGPLDQRGWLRIYVLAISKWLLHYMMSNNYTVAIRMLHSYVYSVEHGQRDMVSLAFLLEPPAIQREDYTGLTRPRLRNTSPISEIELARQFVAQVALIEDIDDRLSEVKAKNVHKVRGFARIASL
jgi:hypothetical protein